MWFLNLGSTQKLGQYKPLTDGEIEQRHETPRPSLSILFLIAFGTAIACLVGGFHLGRYMPLSTQAGLPYPPGNIHQVWEHNQTFSSKPSPDSERAWNAIVPVGRGFVHHDQLAPTTSSIAVFHQLHCLHGLRVTYWKLVHQYRQCNGTGKADEYLEKTAKHTDETHIRHCFDYLRQSIMCWSDSNLEAVVKHRTDGWGSERTCRDYDEVLRWAERYRTNDEVGIF